MDSFKLNRILLALMAMTFFNMANAATDEPDKTELTEINQCELAIGYEGQAAEGSESASLEKQVYCIKDNAAAHCGLIIFDNETKAFSETMESYVPISCANGGFKKLLSQKVGEQKTVRDMLYDGPGAKGLKPVVLRKSTLPMVANFLQVYNDFYQPVTDVQPPKNTATND